MANYRPQSEDTSEVIDRMVFAGLAKLRPEQRLDLAMGMFRAVEQLSIAGLRLQYPNASEEDLRRRAGARRLGRELTLRVYGPEAEAWL